MFPAARSLVLLSLLLQPLLQLCLGGEHDGSNGSSSSSRSSDEATSALLGAKAHASRLRGLQVALHGQVPPTSGFVVGSVMTTMGMRDALRQHPSVARAEVYFPFDYGRRTDSSRTSMRSVGIFENQWDLLIIEGWFPSINSFIHEMRRHNHPSRLPPSADAAQEPGYLRRHGPVVLFWCLDPSFPGLNKLAHLDVDGFLSNSHRAAAELKALAIAGSVTRVAHVPLAADPSLVGDSGGGGGGSNKSSSSSSGDGSEGSTENEEEAKIEEAVAAARGKLVFVGSAGGLQAKRMLAPLLREAIRLHRQAAAAAAAGASDDERKGASPKGGLGEGVVGGDPEERASYHPPGLALFGMGWDAFPEFAPHWHGVLPHTRGALGRVNGAAAAVLGVTMDTQREYGMVNNRIFEVLTSGAFLISEFFPELCDGADSVLMLDNNNANASSSSSYLRLPAAGCCMERVEDLSDCLRESASQRHLARADVVLATATTTAPHLAAGSGGGAAGGGGAATGGGAAGAFPNSTAPSVSTDNGAAKGIMLPLDASSPSSPSSSPSSNSSAPRVSSWPRLLLAAGGDVRAARRLLVEERHTYQHRAAAVLDFVDGVVTTAADRVREAFNQRRSRHPESPFAEPGDAVNDPLRSLVHPAVTRLIDHHHRAAVVASAEPGRGMMAPASTQGSAGGSGDATALSIEALVASAPSAALPLVYDAADFDRHVGADGDGDHSGDHGGPAGQNDRRDWTKAAPPPPLFAFPLQPPTFGSIPPLPLQSGDPDGASALGIGGGAGSSAAVRRLQAATPVCVRPRCPRLSVLVDGSSAEGGGGQSWLAESAEFATTTLAAVAGLASHHYAVTWVDASTIPQRWRPGSRGQEGHHRGDDSLPPYREAFVSEAAAAPEEVVDGQQQQQQRQRQQQHEAQPTMETWESRRRRAATDGHWELASSASELLGKEDMVWAIGCPGTLPDLVARSIPDADTAAGAPRLRALVLSPAGGVCVRDVQRHLDRIRSRDQRQSASSSSPPPPQTNDDGGDAGGEDEQQQQDESDNHNGNEDYEAYRIALREQLKVYDVVFFGNEYDRDFLANTLQLPSLQRAYGLQPSAFNWAEPETTPARQHQLYPWRSRLSIRSPSEKEALPLTQSSFASCASSVVFLGELSGSNGGPATILGDGEGLFNAVAAALTYDLLQRRRPPFAATGRNKHLHGDGSADGESYVMDAPPLGYPLSHAVSLVVVAGGALATDLLAAIEEVVADAWAAVVQPEQVRRQRRADGYNVTTTAAVTTFTDGAMEAMRRQQLPQQQQQQHGQQQRGGEEPSSDSSAAAKPPPRWSFAPPPDLPCLGVVTSGRRIRHRRIRRSRSRSHREDLASPTDVEAGGCPVRLHVIGPRELRTGHLERHMKTAKRVILPHRHLVGEAAVGGGGGESSAARAVEGSGDGDWTLLLAGTFFGIDSLLIAPPFPVAFAKSSADNHKLSSSSSNGGGGGGGGGDDDGGGGGGSGNPRLAMRLEMRDFPTVKDYSDALIMGVTRALNLGRAKTAVSFSVTVIEEQRRVVDMSTAATEAPIAAANDNNNDNNDITTPHLACRSVVRGTTFMRSERLPHAELAPGSLRLNRRSSRIPTMATKAADPTTDPYSKSSDQSRMWIAAGGVPHLVKLREALPLERKRGEPTAETNGEGTTAGLGHSSRESTANNASKPSLAYVWDWEGIQVRSVVVEVQLGDFEVGRDGSWCLFANRHLVTCMLQSGRALRLDILSDQRSALPAPSSPSSFTWSSSSSSSSSSLPIPSPLTPPDYDISFHVELRSSMYSDIIRETPPLVVRLTAPSLATPHFGPDKKYPHAQDYAPDDVVAAASEAALGVAGTTFLRSNFNVARFGSKIEYVAESGGILGEPMRVVVEEEREKDDEIWGGSGDSSELRNETRYNTRRRLATVVNEHGETIMEKPLMIHLDMNEAPGAVFLEEVRQTEKVAAAAAALEATDMRRLQETSIAGMCRGMARPFVGVSRREATGRAGSSAFGAEDLRRNDVTGDGGGYVETEEEEKHVATGEVGVPLHFAATDDLRGVAWAFVKRRAMDQTMGAGCGRGDPKCMARNLEAVMVSLFQARHRLQEQQRQELVYYDHDEGEDGGDRTAIDVELKDETNVEFARFQHQNLSESAPTQIQPENEEAETVDLPPPPPPPPPLSSWPPLSQPNVASEVEAHTDERDTRDDAATVRSDDRSYEHQQQKKTGSAAEAIAKRLKAKMAAALDKAARAAKENALEAEQFPGAALSKARIEKGMKAMRKKEGDLGDEEEEGTGDLGVPTITGGGDGTWEFKPGPGIISPRK